MPEDTTYSRLKQDLENLTVPYEESSDCGDINFTGTISVDGEAGLTGTRTIDGHTLTFKNGILVGYSAP